MKRRTELKLNKAKLFSKKYIFSSRFMVRNTLALLLLGSVAAGGTFTVHTLAELSEKQKIVSAASINSALENVDEETVAEMAGAYEITLDDAAVIDTASVDILKEHLSDEDSFDLAVGDTNNLTTGKIDMKGKFLTTGKDVNIYAEAKDEAEVIGILPQNAGGDVILAGEQWTKITSGGIEGYVSSEDIATGDAAAAIADDAVVKIATVKSDSVNIKKGASEKSEVLFKAESGDSFIVTDVDKYDWANIELVNGEEAYVSAIYVDMEDGFREAVAPNAAESLDASIAEFNGVAPKKAEVATGETADGRISDTVKTAAGFTKAAANDAKTDDKKEDAKSSGSTVQNNDSEQTQEAKNEEPAAAEPVEEPAQEPQQVASNDDLYLLAAIVFAESGGESYDGQLAVANVVLNRQRNGYWGSSLADVIYSPSQFTGCQTSAFRNALSTGGSASCLQAAQDALAGNNNIGSCMYFRPTWVVDTSSLGSYTQIGNHIFW